MAAPSVGKGTPPPAWCRPSDIDIAEACKKSLQVKTGGVEYLSIQQQVNLAEQETNYHNVYRICSEAGLSRNSTFLTTFDPSFETMDLHCIRIWRDGQPRDALGEMKIELIQQEKDLERNMYNGRVSAVGVMRDLRVGDIVETWTTRKGFNPVFKGAYADYVYANWAIDVQRQSARLLVPKSRTLQCKEQGQPVFLRFDEDKADTKELVWRSANTPAVVVDADIPSWYQSFSYVEVSEMPSWAAVASWASELFKPVEAGAELKALTESQAKLGREKDAGRKLTDVERKYFNASAPGLLESQLAEALAILNFVQKDVRYMGIEMGPYSHQPSDPDEVLARRYGDCKDKVRLLCAMLALRGIKAEPVLVNTARGERLSEHLPSPIIFNHVIARLTVGGKHIYVDATNPHQAGPLLGRHIEYDTCGLVVDSKTKDLTQIRGRVPSSGQFSVEEEFHFKDYDSPAEVSVTMHYRGSMAEWSRSNLRSISQEEADKSYFGYYRDAFPKLTAKGSVKWTDLEDQNLVTVEMAFSVPEMWAPRKNAPQIIEASFWPLALRNYFQQPNSLERKAPLAVRHPIVINHKSLIHLPEVHTMEPIDYRNSNDVFDFHCTAKNEGKVVHTSNNWVSKADHVPVGKLSAHVANVSAVRDNIGVSMTRNTAVASRLKEASLNWYGVFFFLVSLVAGVVICWLFMTRWSPPRPPPPAEPALKLGGWLILPALNAVFGPILLLVEVYKALNLLLDWNTWVSMTMPGSARYLENWGLLATLEMCLLCLLLCWGFFSCVLFFRRHYLAPRAFIIYCIARCIYACFQVQMVSWLTPDTAANQVEPVRRLVQILFFSVIWILYFLRSKRVKRTFVL